VAWRYRYGVGAPAPRKPLGRRITATAQEQRLPRDTDDGDAHDRGRLRAWLLAPRYYVYGRYDAM
jgi:hypothetical protein